MKELDLLLLRYLRERWPDAPDDERASFEDFLELPDPQIAAWLLGHESPAPPFAPLIARLRPA